MWHWQGILTIGLLNILIACNTTRSPISQVPIPPADFSATVTSSTAVRLSWTASSGATGYVLERRTGSSGNFSQIATPSSPYDDTGLSPSTEYGYRLKAKNSAGTSAEVQTSIVTPGASGGTASKIGIITLLESGGVGFASASFVGIDQTLSQPPSGLYSTTGTCTVSKTTSPPNPPGLPDPSTGLTPTSLDAGPQITVKGGTETYALLQRQVDNATILYQATNLTPLPESATVDIPGAAGGFPAFGTVTMSGIPKDFDFNVTPAIDAVDKSSTFSWTNPLGSQAQMVFVGYQLVAENEYIGFSCIAPDTGSFSFPAQTKTELDAAVFSKGQVFLAIRHSSRTEAQGTAYLILSSSRVKQLYAIPGQTIRHP